MKKLIFTCLSILILPITITSPTIAAQEAMHTGKINQIFIWPQFRNPYTIATIVYLALEIDAMPLTTCSVLGRVVVASDHPMYETVLTLAITAKTTGKAITIGYLDTCSVWVNSADISQIQLAD